MYPEYNHVKPDVRLILKLGNFLGFKFFEQESKSENSEILAPLAKLRGRKKKTRSQYPKSRAAVEPALKQPCSTFADSK